MDQNKQHLKSGWGERADWYRNIQASPAREVETGGERYEPAQRFLTPEEVYRAMQGYVRRNRWAAGMVTRLLNLRVDGSAAVEAGPGPPECHGCHNAA